MKKDFEEPAFLKAHPDRLDYAFKFLVCLAASEERNWALVLPYQRQVDGSYRRMSERAQPLFMYKKTCWEMIDVRRVSNETV